MKALVLAAAVILLCAVLGVTVTLAVAPAEASVDEGWRLAWMGLGGGALAGAAGLWAVKRRRR